MPESVPQRPFDRRTVLCGLAVALAAPGALAACAVGGAGSDGGGASAPAQPSGGTPLSSIPVGGGTVVTAGDGPVLLVQPTAGTVRAFNARCPHQGTTVDPPVSGTITCPNHFSQFDAATGALKKGPATRGLTEVPVQINGANAIVT